MADTPHAHHTNHHGILELSCSDGRIGHHFVPGANKIMLPGLVLWVAGELGADNQAIALGAIGDMLRIKDIDVVELSSHHDCGKFAAQGVKPLSGESDHEMHARYVQKGLEVLEQKFAQAYPKVEFRGSIIVQHASFDFHERVRVDDPTAIQGNPGLAF